MLAMLLWAGTASAQQIKEHPFYKRLIGEWASEGERKYADGNVIKIKQESKTDVLAANTLTTEGTRERNGQTNHYRWTITLNDSGLIEAMYQPDTGKPDTQRYEVQVTGGGASVEMTALLESNAKVIIVDAFKTGDPDTIESTVTRTDAAGVTIYTGTSVAKRKKT